MDGTNLTLSSLANAGGIMRIMDTSSNNNNNSNGSSHNHTAANAGLHHHHHHHSALSAALASAAAANNAASLTAALNDAANGGIRPGGVAHASIVQSLTNAAGGDNRHLAAFAAGNMGGVAAAAGATPSSANSSDSSTSSSDSDTDNSGTPTSTGNKKSEKSSKKSNNNNNNKGRKLCSLPNSSTAPSKSKDDRPFNTGRWSDDEHQRFLDGLNEYGTGNWKKITEMVGTRSCTQIRTHAQKYFIALQKPAGGVVEKGKKGGSVGSLARKSVSKMITSGAYSGSYGVGELHQHTSPQKGSNGTKRSKRRKLRLTKGGRHSPKSNGALTGLTGIEALARAAEAESETMSHESDSEAEDDSDSGRRKRARLLGANDQPPYEDEADDSDDDDEEDDDDDGSESHDEPPPRRTVQRTSSMLGAAASIASLAKAGTKSSTVSGARESANDVESLREQMGVATETLVSLQKQNREMEIQLLTTIEEKNRAVADCKTLQELNTQIQAEHRRALIMLEQSQQNGAGSGGSGSMTPQQAAEMEARLAQDPQIIALAAANGMSPQDLARLHRQQHEQQQKSQNGQIVELLHAQLTEAEVRFHQVTESLTRQTQVLTDQHRAILELNEKLEKEKAARHALEVQLEQYKKGDTEKQKKVPDAKVEAEKEEEEEDEEEEEEEEEEEKDEKADAEKKKRADTEVEAAEQKSEEERKKADALSSSPTDTVKSEA